MEGIFDYITYPHIFEFEQQNESFPVNRTDYKTEDFPFHLKEYKKPNSRHCF